MKILFSGYHNPHFPTITEYMEEALQSLGHEVAVYDDRQHLIPGIIRDRIHWMKRLDLLQINRLLVRRALEFKPDIAVITGGHRITPSSIATLNHLGIATVLWTIDPPTNFQPILEAARFYSHIFCQGTEAIDLLRQAGIGNAHWLPMACDPAHHHPVALSDSDQRDYAHDVVFVGSFYPVRAQLFERLVHLDLAIWGPGWENLPGGSPLRRFIRGAHTHPSEWLKIYSAAKIVLVTHYQDPGNKVPVYQASPRIFEAMACGSFVISDCQRDVFSLFREGEQLIGYADGDDLVEKIGYYLRHSEARRAIAEKGRDDVVKNHTYARRMDYLLTIVAGNRQES